MKPFRERNPVIVGGASILVMVLFIIIAFKADDLPVIGGGDTYYADFKEAGGLKTNDEVRIAGVRVGKVNAVELAEGEDGASVVRVTFKVDTNAQFGDMTAAAIKVKTILGSMFLALIPAGDGQLEKGSTIPVDRTNEPFNVVDAFSGLSETASKIKKGQLARALTVLSDLTRNTPEEFQSALKGVSTLSATLASRDDQIASLLANLETVAGTLNERDNDIVALMGDSRQLFNALVQRKEAIHNLLESSANLAKQLTLLVRQSRDDLKPALDQLDQVVGILLKNRDNVDESLRLMAPFYRVFANTLGNGPWFDTYIFNMPPVPQVG